MFKLSHNSKMVLLVSIWIFIFLVLLYKTIPKPAIPQPPPLPEKKIIKRPGRNQQPIVFKQLAPIDEVLEELESGLPPETTTQEPPDVKRPGSPADKKAPEDTPPSPPCADDCLFYSQQDVNDDIFLNDDPVTAYEDEAVYSVTGMQIVFSTAFIPVDTGKKYQLSAEVMSLGDFPGDIYVGLAPYDKDYRFIPPEETNRSENKTIVQSLRDKRLSLASAPVRWHPADDYAGRRSLGFYFDGQVDHLPDYVFSPYKDYLSLDPRDGAYQEFSGNTVTLNTTLPEDIRGKIIPGTTAVYNHWGGSKYLYAAAERVTVPVKSWLKVESETIVGQGFHDHKAKFRPGTKYVKIVLLCNYYSARFESNPGWTGRQLIKNVYLKALGP